LISLNDEISEDAFSIIILISEALHLGPRSIFVMVPPLRVFVLLLHL